MCFGNQIQSFLTEALTRISTTTCEFLVDNMLINYFPQKILETVNNFLLFPQIYHQKFYYGIGDLEYFSTKSTTLTITTTNNIYLIYKERTNKI